MNKIKDIDKYGFKNIILTKIKKNIDKIEYLISKYNSRPIYINNKEVYPRYISVYIDFNKLENIFSIEDVDKFTTLDIGYISYVLQFDDKLSKAVNIAVEY